MTAKEWLLRARRLEKRIEALCQAKRRAYDRAVSVTTALRDVPGGREGHSSSGGKTASYAILSDEADRQLVRLESVRAEILRAIGRVQDNTLAVLLTEYYVNGKTWEQVAVNMQYSFAHITKTLHPKALSEITNILNNPT